MPRRNATALAVLFIASAACRPVDAPDPVPAPTGPAPTPPALPSVYEVLLDTTPQLPPGGAVLPLGDVVGGAR